MKKKKEICVFISKLSGCCCGAPGRGDFCFIPCFTRRQEKGQDWTAPLQARGDAWCLGSLRGPAPSHTILSEAGSVQ